MSSRRKISRRQKVEMKKISNESNLQVTFSRRRSGLFKKASELCTLCGAEIALVVFSPREKVFSFGHPNIDTVIDHYLSLVPPQNNDITRFIEAQRRANVHQLNIELTQINNMLDNEKRRHDELSHVHKMFEDQYWWACPIDEMNQGELELFKNALKDLKKQIAIHADMLVIQGPLTLTLPFFQNPMLQPHLCGFNNMGGGRGYDPLDSFDSRV
ncbi:MADS-box transcription factor [Trifolium pratense]|uniref:MADS-box transcription factor n=1 Tax=Trifolium pratense TaxID=57577 RepID=A0A2K3K6W4_TRIPR|nr:MADS-box transcription factor [Trifolium pratense]